MPVYRIRALRRSCCRRGCLTCCRANSPGHFPSDCLPRICAGCHGLMARILRSAGLSGLRFLAFRLSERGSRAEPDQTLHDVDEIGEADGADEEPHPVLRLSEDMLDAGNEPWIWRRWPSRCAPASAAFRAARVGLSGRISSGRVLLPALLASFSARVLRCLGAATRVSLRRCARPSRDSRVP